MMGKSNSNIINNIYYLSPQPLKNLTGYFYGLQQRYMRYGHYYKEHFKLLKKTEFLPTDELEKLQFIYLKNFLCFANQHSYYYNNLFEKLNFIPEDFESFEQLKAIPILTKEQVRKQASKISCSQVFGKTHTVKTSGTSGKPLTLSISHECFQKDYAEQELLLSRYSLNHNNRNAKCAGQPVTHIEQTKPPFWVYDRANNGLYMSSYHLSEQNLPSYIKELQLFKPDILEGYASSLYLLALANKKYNGNVRPKLVRTGSETLLDYQRAEIEDSFKCKAHSFYGSAENCIYAIECEKGKIHMQMLFGFSEFMNKNGQPASPNEEAIVVATGFSNYAFPLIRYNMEDRVVLSENQTCQCGRGGKLFNRIDGRIGDFIITPDDRLIGSALLSLPFKSALGIINAQLIQSHKNELIVNIAIDESYNKKTEVMVLKELRKRLGSIVDIKLNYSKCIPKDVNGKYRFIISRIPKEEIGYNLPNKYE